MALAHTLPESGPGVTCPMCHTVNQTLTLDAVRRGASWACARCGHMWSAARLDAVAAYARFVAAHQLPVAYAVLCDE